MVDSNELQNKSQHLNLLLQLRQSRVSSFYRLCSILSLALDLFLKVFNIGSISLSRRNLTNPIGIVLNVPNTSLI